MTRRWMRQPRRMTFIPRTNSSKTTNWTRRREVEPVNIFLDDGGVMNDNARRGPEWERFVGRFFAPRLGGDPAAWGAVNPPVARREWQRMSAHFTANPGAPLSPFLRSSHAA